MIRIFVLLVLGVVAFSHASAIPQCIECVVLGQVWCPQQRACVEQGVDCKPVENVKWFMDVGTCSFEPVTNISYCPDLEVDLDSRLGTTISGNMIAVPIQPRLLVFDYAFENQTYDVGGYFSSVPSGSQQHPQFFFFSMAIDRFSGFHTHPYNRDTPDEYSRNASEVLQFLDMTVVGNVNLKYGMTFFVSRKNQYGNSSCAFTTSLTFHQVPTFSDFEFTLGVVGIVVWVAGTFALLNFMLCYNKYEKEQEQKRSPENVELQKSSANVPPPPSTDSSESEDEAEEIISLTGAKKDLDNEYSGKTSTIEGWKAYGRQLKEEGKKFYRSCVMSDREFLIEYGVTFYHYICFHRMALVYLLACSAVALAMALPTDLVGGQNRNIVAGDFATSTIASVTFKSKENLVHFFVIIINVALSVGFIWKLRKHSFAVVVAEEEDKLPIQEFAIEIKGIPTDVIDEQILWSHFAHIYGEKNIISAHIPLAYGNRWRLTKLEEMKEKYEKRLEETKERPRIYAHFWHRFYFDATKKVDAILFYEDKIAELQQKTQFTEPKMGTGHAYVTFADADHVKACLKHNNHSLRWYWYRKIVGFMQDPSVPIAPKSNPHETAPHYEALACQNWHVHPAPRPEEICWQNLEISFLERQVRDVLALLLEGTVLSAVLSVTALFAVIEVARDLYLTDLYYSLGGATVLETLASAIAVFLPEAIAILEEAVAPIVEAIEDHAGHVHKSGWRKSVMWHTAFFELMSGLVISRMVYFLIGMAVLYHADAPLNSYHYIFNKTGMDMMKYMMIKTFTVYGIKYPVLCALKYAQYWWSGELERPEFDYYDLYAQKIVVMFCALVYGSVMPLILPLGLLFLGISFVYDRWAIVAFHEKDTQHDSKLLFYAADICSFYFSIVPCATLVIISRFFIDWPGLASALIIFSLIMLVVSLETRRWQHMNQNIKGRRRVIQASNYTPFKPQEMENGAEPVRLSAAEHWQKLAKRTTTIFTTTAFLGAVQEVKERMGGKKLRTHNLASDEELLKAAYVHPLTK